MTVMEHLQAAGYNPAAASILSGIGNAECEDVEIRSRHCIPASSGEDAVMVTVVGKVNWTDGSYRAYPEGWAATPKYRVTLVFPWDMVPEDKRPEKSIW